MAPRVWFVTDITIQVLAILMTVPVCPPLGATPWILQPMPSISMVA